MPSEIKLNYSPVTKTADYTATANDLYIRCNHASTPFTITLPAATGSGRVLIIKNRGAANVTIDGNASETIDGNLTLVLPQWACAVLVDAASGEWDVV